jgi:hypothetical protein
MKVQKVYTQEFPADPGYKIGVDTIPGVHVRLWICKGQELIREKTFKVGDPCQYHLGEMLPGVITKISPKSVTVQSSTNSFFVYQVTLRKFKYANG